VSIAVVLVIIAAPIAIHWYVGVEARHFGREAAEEAKATVEHANFAETEWDKLVELFRDQDFRALIAQQLESQCIDANFLVQLIIQNQTDQNNEQAAAALSALLPDAATPEECAAENNDAQNAQPSDSISTTTTSGR